MDLDQWITALHARVEPAGGRTFAPERAVLYLRPRLQDLPPEWFTEGAIDALFLKLRTLNSADRVRRFLRDYHAQQTPPRPPPISEQEREAIAWEERKTFLRQDWDDPQRIARKVRDCRGNVLMLRLLGKLVRMWAPQHLGFLPPHIVEAIERDAEIAPHDRHLRYADDTPPEGTRSVAEQIASLRASVAECHDQSQRLDAAIAHRPRHLTPEQLDRINPLPNGRKRTDVATPPAAHVDPAPDADASSATEATAAAS